MIQKKKKTYSHGCHVTGVLIVVPQIQHRFGLEENYGVDNLTVIHAEGFYKKKQMQHIEIFLMVNTLSTKRS